jgi:hypothetical protein
VEGVFSLFCLPGAEGTLRNVIGVVAGVSGAAKETQQMVHRRDPDISEIEEYSNCWWMPSQWVMDLVHPEWYPVCCSGSITLALGSWLSSGVAMTRHFNQVPVLSFFLEMFPRA